MRRTATALVLLLLAAAPACTSPAPHRDVEEASPAAATPIPRAAPPARIELHAAAPGLGVLEVESQVVRPLEAAVAGVAGVSRIEGEARADAATIALAFDPGANLVAARAAALEALVGARRSLPEGVTASLGADRASASERLFFALRPGGADPRAVADALAELRRALLEIPGVADLELCGQRREEVVVTVDPARLRALGVSAAALRRSLATELAVASGLAPPGGRLRGAPPGLEDMGAFIVATAGDPPAPITLRDLATIAVELAAPTCDAASPGGDAAVVGVVWPQRRAAVGEVQAAIVGELQALRDRGLAIEVAAAPPVTFQAVAPALDDPSATLRTLAWALGAAAQGLPRGLFLRAPTPGSAGEAVDVELLVFSPADPAERRGLEAALRSLPGVQLRDVAGPDLPAPLRLRVVDDDLERAASIAERAAAIVAAVPGVLVAHSRAALATDLELVLRRDRLAALGLTAREVADAVALALDGAAIGALAGERGEPLPVRLRLGEPARSAAARREAAAALELPLLGGGAVPLTEVADLRLAAAPPRITRVDHRRSLDVEIRLRDEAARAEVRRAVAEGLELPAGVVLIWE